jgi:hypothetical protein
MDASHPALLAIGNPHVKPGLPPGKRRGFGRDRCRGPLGAEGFQTVTVIAPKQHQAIGQLVVDPLTHHSADVE